MKLEVRKLIPGQKKHYSCLYCKGIPLYIIRLLGTDERNEPVLAANVCEKHVGRHFRLLWPMFKLREELRWKEQERIELVNVRIRAKSHKIHEQQDTPWNLPGASH